MSQYQRCPITIRFVGVGQAQGSRRMFLPMNLRSERDRLRDYGHRWSVTLDDATVETASSLIGFGMRRGRAVVLKIVKRPGDEWHAGLVTRAFDGRAMVRVLE